MAHNMAETSKFPQWTGNSSPNFFKKILKIPEIFFGNFRIFGFPFVILLDLCLGLGCKSAFGLRRWGGLPPPPQSPRYLLEGAPPPQTPPGDPVR